MGTVFVLASGANLSAMMTSVGRMNSTPCHVTRSAKLAYMSLSPLLTSLCFKGCQS